MDGEPHVLLGIVRARVSKEAFEIAVRPLPEAAEEFREGLFVTDLAS